MANTSSYVPLAVAQQSSSWTTAVWTFATSPYTLPVLIAYPIVCSYLRYRRRDQLEQRYYHGSNGKTGTKGDPRSLSQMTDNEAYEILKIVTDLEFPAMFEKGLQLALFRTYGIPTIAKLLTQTTQLSDSRTVSKRYADTTVLVTEMYANAPKSERGIEAFARLNYLHGVYIKGGKIRNDDMLYTLALFMNHPFEYINRYEWRQLGKVEKCAIGLWHLTMGTAMEIDFSCLPSHTKGWTDGVHFYDELDTWAKAYEARVMVPDRRNWETAIKTKEYFLFPMPRFAHGFLGKVISAAMDDRLRKAVMFEEPGFLAPILLETLLTFRKLLLRYLSLPRPEFMAVKNVSDAPSTINGRRHVIKYDSQPHYVKPTVWNRYGPSSWYSRAMGMSVPGDAGMQPEGYLIQEMGPLGFIGKGQQEAEKTRTKLRQAEAGGCPFGIRA